MPHLTLKPLLFYQICSLFKFCSEAIEPEDDMGCGDHFGEAMDLGGDDDPVSPGFEPASSGDPNESGRLMPPPPAPPDKDNDVEGEEEASGRGMRKRRDRFQVIITVVKYLIMYVSGRCQDGNTSSCTNTEVKHFEHLELNQFTDGYNFLGSAECCCRAI